MFLSFFFFFPHSSGTKTQNQPCSFLFLFFLFFIQTWATQALSILPPRSVHHTPSFEERVWRLVAYAWLKHSHHDELRLLLLWQNSMTTTNLRMQDFIPLTVLLHHPKEGRAGTQCRNLEAGTNAKAMGGCYLLAYSPCLTQPAFSYTILPSRILHPRGWAYAHQWSF